MNANESVQLRGFTFFWEIKVALENKGDFLNKMIITIS